MQTPALSPYCTVDGVLVALFGGLLLGATVGFKTGCSGGVVGIAGITRGFMVKPMVGKAMFIAGLILAGVIMRHTLDGFEPVPPKDMSEEHRVTYWLRLAGGGLLVGLGTAMGNGCTSGHGLTGLARLSPRSWAAVPTFMFFAALTGTLLGTSGAMPPDPFAEAAAPTWKEGAIWAAGGLVVLAIATLLSFAARRCLSPALCFWCRAAAELLAGLTFGAGLAISSMMRPSKVASFLDIASGAWDPSLGFVMAGGLMFTFPFFQIMERQGFSGPVLGGAFDLPPKNKMPDRTLIAGAAVFGLGWGVVGVCPGPIWVLVGATPCWEILVVLVSMLLGMRAWIAYGRFRDARSAAAAAKEPAPKAGEEAPAAEKDVEAGKAADEDFVQSLSTEGLSCDDPSSPASAGSMPSVPAVSAA